MAPAAQESTIDAVHTITEISVRDIKKATEWYSKVFGKGPDLEPFPGNVEYNIAGAWVQISAGEVKPSSWSIQFEVKDLARERERLLMAGVPVPEIRSEPGVISWFNIRDPDENQMVWFQVLTSDPKVTGKK